jgi:CubicO group peptidase (beta-lactamase class C family)
MTQLFDRVQNAGDTRPIFSIRTVFLLITLLAVSSIGKPSPVAAQRLDTEAVDTLVKGYGAPDRPGVSVAISRDGEIIYEGWSGQADLERNVPIGPETRFHIASISKQFTAFAIHKLADEGKLSLNQEVRDFFPVFRASGDGVTIRHLLDHTSGLREINSLTQILGFSEASPISADRALAMILRQEGRNFDPGTKEEYSNTGYQLLAHIVARASGMPFEDYMQAEIFEPLGMDQTFVGSEPSRLTQDMALDYEPSGEGFAKAVSASASIGSSGIVSTPRNLVRWGHALNSGAIGNARILNAMAKRTRMPDGTTAVLSSGQEFRGFRGLGTWSHGGSVGGYRSFLLRIPQQKLAIAVMGNRADFLKAAFAFDIAEALLGDRLDPAAEPEMSPETTAELDSYTGDYRLFAGTVLSIRRDGETLTLDFLGSGNPSPLPRISKGVFSFIPSRDLRFEFRTFKDGKATELRWQVSEDGFLRAPRVAMQVVPESISNPDMLTGTYYSDELQIGFDIDLSDNGELQMSSSLKAPVPLAPYQPGVLRPNGPSPFSTIDFGNATDTPASEVVVSTTLAENITFKRLADR